MFFLLLVTHKVTAGAKAFGSFFSGVVNKAGDKIKESVKHNVRKKIFSIFIRWKLIFFCVSKSLFSVTLIKSKKHLLRINLAKIRMPAYVHGLVIKMKIKSRMKCSVYQLWDHFKLWFFISKKYFSQKDRRNFVRAPPAGNEFEFNYDNSYPVALALMAEDSALEKMRFDLVPKM